MNLGGGGGGCSPVASWHGLQLRGWRWWGRLGGGILVGDLRRGERCDYWDAVIGQKNSFESG